MILNNEYPAPNPTRRNLIISVLFGAFISFFLIFFEPFNINISSGKDSIGSLFFFGAISTFVLIIFLNIFPFIFPQLFAEKHWKVKHQIIFCSIIMLVIATLNGLYTNYINSLTFSWANYWWIINRTFVLGSIPFSFFILMDYKRRDTINKDAAHSILEEKKNSNQIPKFNVYAIITDLKNESFTFEDQNFTHAVAQGNYTDLYFSNSEDSTSQTYRISLTSFEKQLKATNLQRCHRSYLVNIHKIQNISGNAQGLKLSLVDSDFEIPVSRKYIPLIKGIISKSNEAVNHQR